MIKKGRPADKDKYVHIVLDLLIRKQSSSLTPFMMDLMAVGLNKMTCLELAVIACRLGYQAEYLPSRTEAQRDRIEIIENSVVNFEE